MAERNWEEIWPLDRLMRAKNDWLKTICVGHYEGEKALRDPARKSYFKQKKWKWRYPHTTPGAIVESNWVPGDEFVRRMKNLGLGPIS